ncbi:hypothetical protein ACQ4PT_029743 [Festuca glaucescens]
MLLAPDPLGATQATTTPAAASTISSPAPSLSWAPTLSPGPCPFAWEDCHDEDEPDVAWVLDLQLDRVGRPDLVGDSVAADSGMVAQAFPRGAHARQAPPPPAGTPPRFQPRFRIAMNAAASSGGGRFPPPGSPPAGQPRRIYSRVGAVGGALLGTAGAQRLHSSSPAPTRHRQDRLFKPLHGEGRGQAAHWWRRDGSHSAPAPPGRHASLERDGQAGRAAFLKRLRGRCFKCLSSSHRVASCKGPRVCWRCGKPRHLAWECAEPPASPPPPRRPLHRSTPVTPRRSYAAVLMAPVRGDLSGRPEEDECYVTATQEVLDNERRYNARAVIVNIGRDRPRTEPRHVAAAFRREFGVREEALHISPHFPEDFFILFDDEQAREDAVDRESFESGGRQFNILPWSAERHSEWVAAPYHVRLCIEGLSDEAWTTGMIERIIGRRGTVHFIEGSSVRREDTATMNVWVWTQDPASIPRRFRFNLMNPTEDGDTGGLAPQFPVFRRETPREPLEGRRSRLLIHIDVVEDLTALGRAATVSSVAVRGHRSIVGYDWQRGVEDKGKPEAEVPRRASEMTTRNCKDGSRPSDKDRDRDGDRDGHGGHQRSSRRDRELGKERRSGRSGRVEPYPASRVAEGSRYDGRRRSGGPIRHRGYYARAKRTPARVSKARTPCAPTSVRPTSPPSPDAGGQGAGPVVLALDNAEQMTSTGKLDSDHVAEGDAEDFEKELQRAMVADAEDDVQDVELDVVCSRHTCEQLEQIGESWNAQDVPEVLQLEVRSTQEAEPDEPRQPPHQVQLPVQNQRDTGIEAGNEGGAAPADVCPLAAFIAKITTEIQNTVLDIPVAAAPGAKLLEVRSVRRSARIAKVHKAGTTIEMLAKEAVAKRLGSLPPTASFSDRLLQAYLALFDGPLSDQAVMAIEDLVRTFKKTKRALPVMSVGSGRAGKASAAV